MDQVINTIIWAAIFQGFVLGILYTFSKKHNSFANKLLGLFMFALVLDALNNFLAADSILGYPNQSYFSLPEVKIFLPVLFLHFVLEKLGSRNRFQKIFKIHYILASAVVFITVINIILFVISGSVIHNHFTFDQIQNVFYIQQYYAFILTIFALVIAIRETLKYRSLVQNEYSDITMLEISWLWRFIFMLVPVSILWGVTLLQIILDGTGGEDIVIATWGFVIIFIYFVTYRASQHKNLLEPSGIASKEKMEVEPKDNVQNNDSSFGDQLVRSMEQEKYYLDQDLTIYDLAKELGVPSRQISTTINHQLGHNFSEWVNSFRVERAQALLQDSSNNHLSIEGIGIDSGFKSRSAMYTAFKKKTGQTPGYFKS